MKIILWSIVKIVALMLGAWIVLAAVHVDVSFWQLLMIAAGLDLLSYGMKLDVTK
jgi:hypothetical protein